MYNKILGHEALQKLHETPYQIINNIVQGSSREG